MAEENQTEGDKEGGFNSGDLAPANVETKPKRKPHPKTSVPARKQRTQKPPDLITR
jgi:hypothetical protein